MALSEKHAKDMRPVLVGHRNRHRYPATRRVRIDRFVCTSAARHGQKPLVINGWSNTVIFGRSTRPPRFQRVYLVKPPCQNKASFGRFMSIILGYARVSTKDQTLDGQRENASEAECKRARELDKEVLSQRQSSDYGALSSWDLTLQK